MFLQGVTIAAPPRASVIERTHDGPHPPLGYRLWLRPARGPGATLRICGAIEPKLP
jgi:hypothetical protein